MSFRVFLFILLLSILSCKKEDAIEKQSLPIVGQWQWIKTVGGIKGEYLTPANTKKTQVWIFLSDSSFLHIENNDTILHSAYSVSINDTSKLFKKKVSRLFILPNAGNYVINQCKDTLEIATDVIDGYTWFFKK